MGDNTSGWLDATQTAKMSVQARRALLKQGKVRKSYLRDLWRRALRHATFETIGQFAAAVQLPDEMAQEVNALLNTDNTYTTPLSARASKVQGIGDQFSNDLTLGEAAEVVTWDQLSDQENQEQEQSLGDDTPMMDLSDTWWSDCSEQDVWQRFIDDGICDGGPNCEGDCGVDHFDSNADFSIADATSVDITVGNSLHLLIDTRGGDLSCSINGSQSIDPTSSACTSVGEDPSDNTGMFYGPDLNNIHQSAVHANGYLMLNDATAFNDVDMSAELTPTNGVSPSNLVNSDVAGPSTYNTFENNTESDPSEQSDRESDIYDMYGILERGKGQNSLLCTPEDYYPWQLEGELDLVDALQQRRENYSRMTNSQVYAQMAQEDPETMVLDEIYGSYTTSLDRLLRLQKCVKEQDHFVQALSKSIEKAMGRLDRHSSHYWKLHRPYFAGVKKNCGLKSRLRESISINEAWVVEDN
ncbi:hypothetical protein NM208_g7360 [Fusarium decemcellulare]|uniref:Uncharacterized protein n=2 Tax=Fusarium decemcellulare TaxID=57161 RepID=A0ACC1S649_9HYPO|nr:hypothetical protein NM208_g8276 [Fusarium decemcellulare]KAJ3534897.1 hypothetical protein NM208_g7360 [Fusarium decemcellulare]